MSIRASEAEARAKAADINQPLVIAGKTYDMLLERQDRAIEEACDEGRRKALFYIHETVWSDEWEDRMRKHYADLGYTFKPVGMMNGVYQKDEYICW